MFCFSIYSIPPPISGEVSLYNCIMVTREDVVAMLLKLDIRKSCGRDTIPNAVLRRYPQQIAQFFTNLFNLWLATRQTPNDCSKVYTTPIHKKGDRFSLSNYRPISMTSTPSKLFEQVIATYISDFLAEWNIRSPYQHGFGKQLACDKVSHRNLLHKFDCRGLPYHIIQRIGT